MDMNHEKTADFGNGLRDAGMQRAADGFLAQAA